MPLNLFLHRGKPFVLTQELLEKREKTVHKYVSRAWQKLRETFS